jgi:hypothetical protein
MANGVTTTTLEFWELRVADGGGMSYDVVGRVSSEDLAREWKDKSGWRSIEKVILTFSVAHSLEALDELDRERARQAALKKLTPAERQLLGLTED